MTPAVTVVVPAHSDEPSLPLTLRSIVRAARAIDAPSEILLAFTTAPGSRPPVLDLDGEIRTITVTEPGKVAALQAAVREAGSELLVLVDADVIPAPNAFQLILEPLLAERADVCGGRPRVSCRPGASGVAKWLERWNGMTLQAWHLLRAEYPGQRWALSGALYALRRNLYPPTLLAPLVDDLSIGLQVRQDGARFAYAPDAVVHVLAPTSYREWLCRKIQNYRYIADLRRLHPVAVNELERAFRRCLRQAVEDGTVADWLLIYQLRLLHWAARASVRVHPPAAKSWTPAISTKQWSAAQARTP
jgi:cellulose synthase/poly-beta-1,6-N-acetylglucosamine synthase-like glycosyltransferase